MNILLVTGDFAHSRHDTALGGMARAVYRHAYELQKRGNRVRVLSGGREEKKWFYQGIEVYTINADFTETASGFETVKMILNREVVFQKKITELHKREQIDIIQYTGWFGVGLFHYSKIPAVMRTSSYSKQQLNGNYSFFKQHIFSFFEKAALHRMNAVFAPSNIMAQAIMKDIKKKVWVLETPYIFPEIVEDRTVADTQLKAKKYLLFVGRMTKDKGIYEIKDILNPLLGKYSDLYFAFAGNSPDKDMMKKIKMAAGQYSDRVIFLGHLQQELLFPVIREAQAVVMPSRQDNFPNACAEAMSVGQIVIGTDGSSLEQFIAHGKNGFLCEIGNSKSLIKTTSTVLALSLEERKQISESAIERITELDVDEYTKKLVRLYRKIINLNMKNRK